MNRHAASAQIESEDVDAVSVFITGDKDSSARNANMEDFTVFASIEASGNSRFNTRAREGRDITRLTVCRFPRLVEFVRQLDLDDLPHEVS